MRSLIAPLLLALAAAPSAQDNVLIVVVDDVGIDQIPAYGLGADLPPTPTLDSFAAEGVLFRNAYSNPVCSPTRAQVLTGRHAFRTGIGHIVGPGMTTPEFFQLAPEETILPEMLDLGTGGLYDHAAIGKWHLYDGAVGFETAPNDAGFNHFAGTPSNLGFDFLAYYNWLKVVDGSFFVTTTYATTDQIDEALAFMSTAPEPWLCYLAFSAAHVPFHEPPAQLHTQDLSAADPITNPRPYYKATVEAIDTELGRMKAGMGALFDRTNMFFLADNGTPFEVVIPPFDPQHAKVTLYEGGCHVPFLVTGPAVAQPGTESDALVSMVDLFATIAELAAVDLDTVMPPGFELDSVSLLPYLADSSTPSLRRTVFSQLFGPLGSAPYNLEGYMLRDDRYKLIRVFTPGLPGYPVEFYDLWNDPHEQNDLLGVGLTPDQLDRLRDLELEAAALLRQAQTAGPSGSEEHVVLASNAGTTAGTATSESYSIDFHVGQPAASAVLDSATFQGLGGIPWTTGGIATERPVVFGFSDALGAKEGGEVTSLFGFGLDELSTASVLDLDLGGQPVAGLNVLSSTHAQVTTPSGANQHGNPIGAETLSLFTDDGPLVRARSYTYTPAIDLTQTPTLGGEFRLRVAVNPGDTFMLLWSLASTGFAVPIAPIAGKLELIAPTNLLQPSPSLFGEELVVVPIPPNTSAVGLSIDIQGIAGPLTAPTSASWTNRLAVTLVPEL
ncbi:MAG: sulfatase-like hydrolase/transferase [Planctomycetota bacterium]